MHIGWFAWGIFVVYSNHMLFQSSDYFNTVFSCNDFMRTQHWTALLFPRFRRWEQNWESPPLRYVRRYVRRRGCPANCCDEPCAQQLLVVHLARPASSSLHHTSPWNRKRNTENILNMPDWERKHAITEWLLHNMYLPAQMLTYLLQKYSLGLFAQVLCFCCALQFYRNMSLKTYKKNKLGRWTLKKHNMALLFTFQTFWSSSDCEDSIPCFWVFSLGVE